MSARELTADRETCIGSGNCVRVAPQVFDQDIDGHVVVVDDADAESQADAVELAVAGCPVGALRWE